MAISRYVSNAVCFTAIYILRPEPNVVNSYLHSRVVTYILQREINLKHDGEAGVL